MKKYIILSVILLCLSFFSCKRIASKIISEGTEAVVEKTAKQVAKKAAKEGSEEFAEKTVKQGVKKTIKESSEEAGEKAAKKGVKEIVEEGGEDVIEKTLKELAQRDKALKDIYDHMITHVSKDFADGITVKSTKEGMELVSKDFPTSMIKINKNIITAKAGSLKNAGPVNEFLNHLMPNKTYMLDGCYVFKTDKLGRVVEASADRTKAFKTIQRNTQRNSDVQNLVIDQLGGRHGLDDAGHLFSNVSGGPNELINQVPMAKELNRTGAWRKLEKIEEKALKEGKNVTSQRKLLYKGDSKRPYAIEVVTKVDGVEVIRQVIDNVL